MLEPKRYLLIAILLFFNIALLHSQPREIVLKGHITDKSHKSLPYSGILNLNTGAGVNANDKGEYLFRTNIPANFNVFSLGYFSKQKRIEKSDADTLITDFMLEQDTTYLQAVDISAAHKPVLLKEAINLIDFEVKDNQIWMLYSMRSGSKIEVTNTDGNLITQKNIKYAVKNIDITPHDFLFSNYKDSIYFYSIKNEKLAVKAMGLDTYNKSAESLVGYKSPYYYYHFKSKLKTQVTYSFYDKESKALKVLYDYSNSTSFIPNRQTEEVIAAIHMLARENPDDASTGGGYATPVENKGTTVKGTLGSTASTIIVSSNHQAEEEAKLLLLSRYKALGATPDEISNSFEQAQVQLKSHARPPLLIMMLRSMMDSVVSFFKITDQGICIFNFTNDSIYQYASDNSLSKQSQLLFDHPGREYRKKEIILDDTRREFYYKYMVGTDTYLEKIDMNSDKTTSKILLKYPFINKIRIEDGCAYFSYFNRTDNSGAYSGQVSIYKQRLD